MNTFLTVFGTIIGCFILLAGLLQTNIGIILTLVLSMAGFIGPITVGFNKLKNENAK